MNIKTEESLINFKSNGTNWQIKNQLAKRYHLRWGVSLIVTNIIVLLLCRGPYPEKKLTNNFLKIPDNYGRLVLPMKVFIPLSTNSQIRPISIGIFSHTKRLLIAKAFFHPKKIASDNRPGIANYQVDIPRNKLHLILPYLDSYLLAYPSNSLKKERDYEVVF